MWQSAGRTARRIAAKIVRARPRPLNVGPLSHAERFDRAGWVVIAKLYFDAVLVGDLADLLEHQGTWFASFKPRLPAGGDRTEARVAEFIRFCEDWHGRLDAGSDPDAEEFDAFADVVKSESWRVVDGGGTRVLDGAPVFADGEVSWSYRDDVREGVR